MDFHPVEANLRQSFRLLGEGRTRADVLELPGISIASLGASFQMFNTVFLNAPVASREDFETRLERARLHFTSRGIAWAFWFCEDWMDPRLRRGVSESCRRFGLRLSSEMPGMIAAPPLAQPKRSLPALDLRRVDDARTLADFRAIGAVSFHVPHEWFSEVFDGSIPGGRPDFVCYVGYSGEVPVATSASVRTFGSVGLYNIATAPSHRGRGYGEAITRLTIDCAEDGRRVPLVLQSTSQGQRIYERLGFRTVTRILVYNSV